MTPHREDAAHPATPEDATARTSRPKRPSLLDSTREPLRRTLSRSSQVGLFVVAVLAGLLFASNAALFRGTDGSRPTDLAGLIREENARVAELEDELTALRARRDELLADSNHDIPAPEDELLTGGYATALEGEGLRVEMWDATGVLPEGSNFDVNDLVVHQQDLEGVLNALRAGGADAISLQGQRLTATSAVRCVGNVLLLHGRQYSPPYVIEAIGDPEALQRALDSSRAVQIYRQYVDAVGLGWQVTTVGTISMPAATDPGPFTYAQELA